MQKEHQRLANRLYFDPQDYEMLRIVNDVLERGQYSGFKRILAPYLHPNGIKQMAATRGLRIAYAIIHLLSSLEQGKAQDRIAALRSLKEEVLMASESTLSINTARVLLQIMKELVRSGDDPLRQLVLAHDFRRAILGNPRVIRRKLRKYHLIEISEDWSQLAFDDHVHDANTKGRKSPTHLIMDAWIKGIRKLTVIYYTIINTDVAAELLEAAKIMGLSARIGIELRVRHRNRFIKLLWTPRELADQGDFLKFMNQPDMLEFRKKGREVLAYQRAYIWDVLKKYNQSLRQPISESLGVALPEISKEAYLDFVGVGQPTLFHLGSMISSYAENSGFLLSDAPEETTPPGTQSIDAEDIIERWLDPLKNPEIHNPFVPHEGEDEPDLLSFSAPQMIAYIQKLHVKNWLTLDMNGLSTDEVLTLLHQSKGGITHLEIFNLHYYEKGKPADYASILELQSEVSSANVVRLKKFVHRTIEHLEATRESFREQRLQELNALLEDLSSFHALYKNHPLRLRLGTDSTGQSYRRHGMGFVVLETLPRRSQWALQHSRSRTHLPLPVAMDVSAQVVFSLRPSKGPGKLFAPLSRLFPGCLTRESKPKLLWKRDSYRMVPAGTGNIYTLGGLQKSPNGHEAVARPHKKRLHLWQNMNSHLKNLLKIFLGFVPAALSFYFTKDWWLLAYFGPFIWFGITGLRNIIQSVLACGGFQRSSLLKWNDFVSWKRFFRFALLHRILRTAAGLSGKNRAARPRSGHHHRDTADPALYHHGAGQRRVHLLAQRFSRPAPPGGCWQLLPKRSVHPAGPALQHASGLNPVRLRNSQHRRDSSEMGGHHFQIRFGLCGRCHRGHGGPLPFHPAADTGFKIQTGADFQDLRPA